jgi:FixJ family two-component response regulator
MRRAGAHGPARRAFGLPPTRRLGGWRMPLRALVVLCLLWLAIDTSPRQPMDNIKVAIIDDDASWCRALTRMLRGVGIDATSYASAESFLAARAAPDFACLLVDIQLGGMSGLELFRELRGDAVRTPVIFITAFEEPGQRDEAMLGGCAGFFRKSDPGAVIVSAMRSAAPSLVAP